MSTPESIVVSLEKARELEEAGWVGSEHLLWAYHCFDYPKDSKFQEPFLTCRELEDHYHQWEFYDAPTAEEILRRLPWEIVKDGLSFRLAIWWEMDGVKIFFGGNDYCLHSLKADTLVNAAASMWIYLSENNLLPKA